MSRESDTKQVVTIKWGEWDMRGGKGVVEIC